jgi:hypothetical protein
MTREAWGNPCFDFDDRGLRGDAGRDICIVEGSPEIRQRFVNSQPVA